MLNNKIDICTRNIDTTSQKSLLRKYYVFEKKKKQRYPIIHYQSELENRKEDILNLTLITLSELIQPTFAVTIKHSTELNIKQTET